MSISLKVEQERYTLDSILNMAAKETLTGIHTSVIRMCLKKWYSPKYL